MKKTLLAIALATAAIGASAHPRQYTHYHTNDGRVVIGNTVAPQVETRYEMDNRGRRIRVVETTSCTDVRVNPRNNHIRCIEREVRTQRYVETRPTPAPREPDIADRVERRIERDSAGRRVIVTTTQSCVDSAYNRRGQAVCLDWDTTVTREYVRRPRGSNTLDLNGDGRTDAWEQLLFQGFRDVLDDNN